MYGEYSELEHGSRDALHSLATAGHSARDTDPTGDIFLRNFHVSTLK